MKSERKNIYVIGLFPDLGRVQEVLQTEAGFLYTESTRAQVAGVEWDETDDSMC
jgi:hypothetical protein